MLRKASLEYSPTPLPSLTCVTSLLNISAQPHSVISRGTTMPRERVLKVVLVVVGLIFCALVYPLTVFGRKEPALAMMLSVYVTLGIFLLLAARQPSANRSLIAFTAWSSFAHAALMAVQASRHLVAPGELWGVAALVIIGVSLIVLSPRKPPAVLGMGMLDQSSPTNSGAPSQIT